MNERREPTISTYAPTKEELARHQSSDQKENKRSNGKGPSPSRPTAKASTSSPNSARVIAAGQQPKSILAPIAMFVAILACGAAGVLYWQLTEMQKMYVQADLRIAELESKFELSDDESTASTATMQAKLKWADSEIRKLWGVSHDTNRKAIAANKEAIAKASKAASKANKSVASAKALIDKSIQGATRDLNAEIKLVSDLLDAQQAAISGVEQSILERAGDDQAAKQKMAAMEDSNRKLERRIKTNETAIEAIDAFRRNVNQQIIQLRGAGTP